jgi:hypothetical protein
MWKASGDAVGRELDAAKRALAVAIGHTACRPRVPAVERPEFAEGPSPGDVCRLAASETHERAVSRLVGLGRVRASGEPAS